MSNHFLKSLFMLALVIVLAACGGKSEPAVDTDAGAAVTESKSASSTSESSAELPPTPNAGQIAATQAALLPPQEPIDACQLVSAEEAAAFLGAEVTSVESETGTHTGECKYIAQTSTDRLHLKISWTPNFGAGDYELVRSMVQNPREAGTDIGDDYYIRDELSGVQLRLVRGEQYLILEAYGVSESDGPLKELARRLLAEIPAP